MLKLERVKKRYKIFSTLDCSMVGMYYRTDRTEWSRKSRHLKRNLGLIHTDGGPMRCQESRREELQEMTDRIGSRTF